MTGQMKVLHIINSLDQGGAEIMLAGLLEHSDQRTTQYEVISLTTQGPVSKRISALGIPVNAVQLNFINFPWALLRLFFLVWRSRPDIVQTWMYHSNFFGGIAGKLFTRARIVWGLHASRLDPLNTKVGTLLAIKVCTLVANWLPDKIICCSESAQAFHHLLGYDPAKTIFVPNGFDLALFQEKPGAKTDLISELDLKDETCFIGMIARYHPNKDHRNFFVAASLVRQHMPNVHFVCCGKDVTRENAILAECIEEFDLSDCCTLMGERGDIPQLAAALDIVVSSSFIGEAFPLVLGEAMACGTPCVTTNVGDAAAIVGEMSQIVQPRDPGSLADALVTILRLSPTESLELSKKARHRIATNYGIHDISKQYSTQYESLLND